MSLLNMTWIWGVFSEIKHQINTGSASPVRQNMRRTPFEFEKEEETHLKKDVRCQRYTALNFGVVICACVSTEEGRVSQMVH